MIDLFVPCCVLDYFAQSPPEHRQALDLARQILGEEPLSAIREPLGRSGNGVFTLALANGHAAILRVSPRPQTFASTPQNFAILRQLGFPVPAVLAHGIIPSGGSYILLERLPGRDIVDELPGLSRAQTTQIAADVVKFARRLAQYKPGTGFGWAAIGRGGKLPHWTCVFGDNSGSACDEIPPPPARSARLIQARATLENYFTRVTPLCFLDDLTIRNLLISSGRISGIIDVDFVCYGDPLLAVGTTLAEIVRDVGEPGLFYGEDLVRLWQPDPDQQRAIKFYAALFASGFLNGAGPALKDFQSQQLASAADKWLAEALPAQAHCPGARASVHPRNTR